MEFRANEGKSVTIEVNGKTYARHAIQTHFVQVGESYVELVEKYVKPVWQPGDLLSSSEKIIGLCQKRVVYKLSLIHISGGGQQGQQGQVGEHPQGDDQRLHPLEGALDADALYH